MYNYSVTKTPQNKVTKVTDVTWKLLLNNILDNKVWD